MDIGVQPPEAGDGLEQHRPGLGGWASELRFRTHEEESRPAASFETRTCQVLLV